MKPVDLRDMTWRDLQERVEGERQDVLEALRRMGPRTTRALAAEMGRDILTVRPRVTELGQLGAVALVGAEGREGVYRALGVGEWADWFAREKDAATRGEQMELGL